MTFRFRLKEYLYFVTLVCVFSTISLFDGGIEIALFGCVAAGMLIAVLRANTKMRKDRDSDLGIEGKEEPPSTQPK